jgi:tetratricopeptide (TPR) repeat protein
MQPSPNIPYTLKESLRSRNITPFVGAGVSMAVRDRENGTRLFPSWRELLQRAADRLSIEEKLPYANAVRALLELNRSEEYLAAAKRAREGLGALWFDFLKEQFDFSISQVADESLELAESIWHLGSPLLITTNYDRVLHWACPDRNDVRYWDIEAPAEQIAALRQRLTHPTVWHLHGSIDNATNMILTPDGYRLLYPEKSEIESSYRAALATLRSFLSSRSFLFIGYSLEDVHLVRQLTDVRKIFSGVPGPHYILTREKDSDRVRALNLPIEVVTFADFGESALELLRSLSDIVAQTGTPAAVRPASRSKDREGHTPTYSPRNPVFFVPLRSKGEEFIGRETTLIALREQLTKGHRTATGRTAALQGLGGLGKTQVAVEYAYRYRNEYPNGVIWLNAGQDIDAQLTDLAEKARWIAPESEHKLKLEIARHRLRTYSDCLIIFDNLEDVSGIEKYMPSPDVEPHILATSRADLSEFTPVPLDPLDEESSFELLCQATGQEPHTESELESARFIAVSLGGLPLALELAGAYLRHRFVGWQRYSELLGQNLAAALPSKFLRASLTLHEGDLYSTLKISQGVFADDPQLKEIVDLLTWSGGGPMSRSLLCSLLDVRSESELTSALGLGTALRLLKRTQDDQEVYIIHSLLREVRRKEAAIIEHLEWAGVMCQRLGDWFQQRREKFSDLSSFEAEIDHLKAWQQHALHYFPKEASRLTWLRGYPPYHRGQYQEAKEWVEKSLELFRQEEQDDRELLANLLDDLGSTNHALGDQMLGLEHAEQALKIRQELFGERHPATASSLSSTSRLYLNVGNIGLGLQYAEKSLEIRQELFGTRHPDTASSLSLLGTIYVMLGDYHRALGYTEEALRIQTSLFGELDPDAADLIESVAGSNLALGEYDRALEYAEKALSIHRGLFGERHPSTASSYVLVSSVYTALCQFKRALGFAEKALEIELEVFGDQHYFACGPLNAVCENLMELRSYGRALELAEKTLEIQRKHFGEKHVGTSAALNTIGMCYVGLGRYEEALELVQEALAIRRELLGDRHPTVAISLNNLSQVYLCLKDRERAYEYSEQALKLNREILGDLHPKTVICAQNLSMLLFALERRSEGFSLLYEFLGRLPRGHPHYARMKHQLKQLLASPLRRGFRQPSMKKSARKRKHK